jgi:hypothetical protein
MDYLDYELHRYQESQDATCDYCGECILEEYYSCSCDEDVTQQINYQR